MIDAYIEQLKKYIKEEIKSCEFMLDSEKTDPIKKEKLLLVEGYWNAMRNIEIQIRSLQNG